MRCAIIGYPAGQMDEMGDPYDAALNEALDWADAKGCDSYWCGMMDGVDCDALSLLIERKRGGDARYNGVKLIGVRPYPSYPGLEGFYSLPRSTTEILWRYCDERRDFLDHRDDSFRMMELELFKSYEAVITYFNPLEPTDYQRQLGGLLRHQVFNVFERLH